MKTLLVLRHAKSSWDDASLDDRERPLNARGRRDAPRMGDLLRDTRLVPDLIITSDAVRAHTTAVAVAEAAGYNRDLVVDPQLYHADPDDIVAVLRLIGRDLVLDMLDAVTGEDAPAAFALVERAIERGYDLRLLCRELARESHDLPTAALVHLALPIQSWRSLTAATPATLVALWRPKELP